MSIDLLKQMYAARRAATPTIPLPPKPPKRRHRQPKGIRPSVPSGPRGADGLTPRQREVLDVFAEYTQQHGMPPSFRDAAKELGINSLNGIYEHVKALERKGFLRPVGEGQRQRYVVVSRNGCCPMCGR